MTLALLSLAVATLVCFLQVIETSQKRALFSHGEALLTVYLWCELFNKCVGGRKQDEWKQTKIEELWVKGEEIPSQVQMKESPWVVCSDGLGHRKSQPGILKSLNATVVCLLSSSPSHQSGSVSNKHFKLPDCGRKMGKDEMMFWLGTAVQQGDTTRDLVFSWR